MSNVMEQTMRAPLSFGIPTSHFDLALLWGQLAPLNRRASPSPVGDPGHRAFPSWSWSGWSGKGINYPRDFIADCLDDVNEWLRLRTWIRWYARNDSGDLCPLWDEAKWQADLSEHRIWRGYGRHRSSGSKKLWQISKVSQDLGISCRGLSSDSLMMASESGSSDFETDSPYSNTRAGVMQGSSHRMNRRHHKPDLSKDKPTQQSAALMDELVSKLRRLQHPDVALTLRELPRSLTTGRVATKTLKGRVRIKSDRESQSGPLRTETEASWMQRPREILVWLKDSYRDEIVVYWIEVSLSTLRLLTHLLGIPMLFTRAPRPPQNLGMNQLQPYQGPGYTDQRQRYLQPQSGGMHGRGGYNRDLPSPFSGKPEFGQSRANSCPPPPPPPGLEIPPPSSGLNRMRDPSPSCSIGSRRRRIHDMIFEEDGVIEPEHTESEPRFRITLEEFPYLPRVVPFLRRRRDSKIGLMPVLQFWTWHSLLHIQSPPLAEVGLTRCNVADKFGDWCGSIMLDNVWLKNTKTAKQEFIALSEAKRFTDEECGIWSYYIPKEREESEWDLFFVMLIEWSDGRWERVGLGKVFKEAFRDATWKEIVLA